MIKLQCDYKRGERTQMRRHIAGSAVGKSSGLFMPRGEGVHRTIGGSSLPVDWDSLSMSCFEAFQLHVGESE
jgi:hypothetical protein